MKSSRSTSNNIFKYENLIKIKLITRLSVGRSHLLEGRFTQTFHDISYQIFSCYFDDELSSLCVFHCAMYNYKKHTILNTIKNIDCRLLCVTETIFDKTLYENCSVDAYTNRQILNARIRNILSLMWAAFLGVHFVVCVCVCVRVCGRRGKRVTINSSLQFVAISLEN